MTFNTGTLSATNGSGLQFDNADGNYNFNGTTTLNGGDAGIDILNGSSGTFSFSVGSSITNPSGTGFNLLTSTANVTYNGTISKGTAGRAVIVDDHDSGTIAFGGAISSNGSSSGILVQNSGGGAVNFTNQIALNTSSNNAVTLTNNGGGIISFNCSGDGLDINTTSGTGFSATGGGTVTVQGTGNTIATTANGTALNVTSTTIGASGLTFQSISSNGSANGIILNTTGSSGGLTVTGNGGTCTDANTSGCSGGVIQNMAGADDSSATPIGTGIVLNNATGVSLTRMYIHDHSNYGIRGTSVNGFTLNNSVVSGVNGTNVSSPFSDGSLSFDNLSGTSAITNSAISGGFQRNVRVDNTAGTLNLTVNSNSIHNTGNSAGDDGLFVEVGGGTATLIVTNNTFAAHGGDHFNLSLLGSPTVGLTFTGNFWTGGHPIGLGQGLFILAASFNVPGLLTYNISNNGTVGNPLVGNNSGGAMHVNKGSGTGSFSGTISNNVIGNPAVNSSGSLNASGIDVEVHGSGGSHTTAVTNNQVRQFHNDGILLLAGEGNAVFNATVTGNTVTNPDASVASFHGMQLNIGTLPTDGGTHCLDVRNNTLTNAANEPNGGVDLRMRQRQLTTVRLPGYGGANNDNAAVQTFLTVTNANALTTILAGNTVATGGGGFIGGAACTQPSLAEPADEVAVHTAGTSENTVNFLNAPYQSPLERIKWSVESGGSANSEEWRVENGELANVGELRVESGVSEAKNETLGNLGYGAWDLLAKLGEMISPTVYSQETKESSKDGTPNAPVSGETITVDGGGTGFTLPAAKSITVTYKATVNAQPPFITQVSNQGTVSGGNFSNVLTDDPAVGGAADPTVTLIDSTTVAITSSQNASITGQSVTFTATLTGAPAHASGNPGGTVQFLDDGNPIGAPVAVVAGAVNTGTAQLAYSGLTTGNHTITASYTGGTGFNASNGSMTGNPQVVGNMAVWDGSASSDWNTAANWATNFVPLATNDVSLPASGVTNQAAIPSGTLTVNNLTVASGRTLTLSGGNLTVNGVLTMNGGDITVNGADLLTIGSGGSITRTSGIIIGNIKKTFAGAGAFTYPVGTAGAYSPVDVTVTAGSGDLTVKANTGTAPATPVLNAATTLQRFWTLSGSGITASVTWHYLQTDVAGTESNYKTIRVTGGTPTSMPNAATCPGAGSPCVDTGANTIFISGISSFSDWTAGELAPTAANVGVSGRVLNRDGRGVASARVAMADENNNVVYSITNPFGYYRFTSIAAGHNYIVSVTDKRYTFQTRLVTVNDELTGLDFVAQ